MGKTDKTAPYWRKVAGHPIEVHNHENGVCDIAGHRPDRETVGWRGGRCHFEGDWSDHIYWCGCDLCGHGPEENRRRRAEGQRQARDWWKE